MSEWFLQAKISNPDLLFEIIHALGQTFYRKLNGEYEVVYFSGSKAIYFKGKLSKQEAEKLKQKGKSDIAQALREADQLYKKYVERR